MLSKALIQIIIIKMILAQFDGEFWWLNDKVTKLRGVQAPPVKYENLSDYDTDESDKVVFRDSNSNAELTELMKENIIRENSNKLETLSNNSTLHDSKPLKIYPDFYTNLIDKHLEQNNKTKANKKQINTDEDKENHDDILNILFPDDALFNWASKETNFSTTSKNITFDKTYPWKIKFRDEDKIQASESICTIMNKSTCCQKGGIVINNGDDKITWSKICCVLPLSIKHRHDESEAIHFVQENSPKYYKRNKRSDEQEVSLALRQRRFLLLNKYASSNNKPKPIPLKTPTKIETTEDDYTDPYWNIKNTNFHTPNKHKNHNEPSYEQNDYVDDYVVELPRPGLVGIYSDHSQRPPSWAISTRPSYGSNVDNDDDSNVSFGYSTVDPRLVDRTTSKSHNSKRPMKLISTNSDEINFDSKHETISYIANPDFKVLEGFKLKLGRNGNKVVTNKNDRLSTTARNIVEQVPPRTRKPVSGMSSENEGNDSFEYIDERYDECGQRLTNPYLTSEESEVITDVSQPWLSLVVLTRRLQSIVCYSTIIHPRASITTGDCVHGMLSGDLTIVAGLKDLRDRSHAQQRIVSYYLHPEYKKDAQNNLAILHWKRPLQLDAYVQIACLGDPHVGDYCKLVGYGGYDQALQPRLGWQRVDILTPKKCRERLPSKSRENLSQAVYCASTDSSHSVTGIGGPLLCKISGRETLVGVAVSRDDVILMIPPQDWTLQTLPILNLN